MMIPFEPPPGIYNDGTGYASKGKWFNCDKVRFRDGMAERIGGWTKLTGSAFLGVCRGLFQWANLSSVRRIGIGTSLKYYIENGSGGISDNTPLRSMTLPTDPIGTSNGFPDVTVTHVAHGIPVGAKVLISNVATVGGLTTEQLNGVFSVSTVPTSDTYTYVAPANATGTATGGGSSVTVLYDRDFTVPLQNNPFATVNVSPIVTVTHIGHGALIADYVKFSGATAVAGLTISGEYQVTSVIDANNYTISAGSNANAATTGGGAAVRVQYQINTGPADFAPLFGWGSGAWGSGGWSNASSASGPRIRLWSHDNFGEDLVINPRAGGIYYYDTSTGARPIDMRLLSGATKAPSLANFVMTSAQDRRVFAFGVNDIDGTTIDPMLVRWSDSESAGDWNPTAINSAGSLRVSVGSEIKCAVKAKGEILIFTDNSVNSLRFTANALVYGLQLVSPNIDIISPGSVISIDDRVYWMGKENFFMYNGRAETMPCSVRQFVFNDLNLSQSAKIQTGSNRWHREVWWLYPSSSATEIDRYVVFNYSENVWYYGTLDRTAWADSGLSDSTTSNPIAASTDGFVYYQEDGWDDGSTSPPSPIYAFISSGPVEIGVGDRLAFVRRIIPDVTFNSSTTGGPSVLYSFTAQNYPGSPYLPLDTGSGLAVRYVATPVEQFTEKINLRLRGRQFNLTISSDDLGVAWRLGVQRFDAQPDGAR